MKLIEIIVSGLLYLFNVIYRFIPNRLTEKYKMLRYIGIIVALLLAVIFISNEVVKYKNYSYAKVSQEGAIIERRNFNYELIMMETNAHVPVYVIINKYDIDNVNIKTQKNITSKLSTIVPGVKIELLDKYNNVVKSNFTIEIKK